MNDYIALVAIFIAALSFLNGLILGKRLIDTRDRLIETRDWAMQLKDRIAVLDGKGGVATFRFKGRQTK